jgi:hypothetical protein
MRDGEQANPIAMKSIALLMVPAVYQTLLLEWARRTKHPKAQNQQVVDTMIAYLQIAFGLYEALPIYLAHTVVPKLSLALAAVASYVSNKELAIRVCWEGLRCTHSEDVYSKAVLHLQA